MVTQANPTRPERVLGFDAREHLFSPEHEDYVVALLIGDPHRFDEIDIDPADFHNQELAAIFATARDIHRQGRYADQVTIADELERQGRAAPEVALARLNGLDPTWCNLGEYAAKVRDLAQRRRALRALERAAAAVYDRADGWQQEISDISRGLEATWQPALPTPTIAWTATELLDAQFPDPQWAVAGLIPVGLTILAGRPKVGKSWLAQQIMLAVGSGGQVLGRDARRGRVLYLALEDNGRRLKQRVLRQGMTRDCDARFVTAWPRQRDGGLQQLARAIEQEQPTLVIIDTLGRFVGRADTNDYGDMTQAVGSLQELAMVNEVALLVVDHHRKSVAGFQSDPVDDIVGSTGKAGAADAILGLTTQQGKSGATLRVRGRDVEQQDLTLAWEAERCIWTCDGASEDGALRGRRGDVLAALREALPGGLTATEIAERTGLHRPNIATLLEQLMTAGHVSKLPKQGRDQPYIALVGEA